MEEYMKTTPKNKSKTVLIVEDDKTVLKILVRLLSSEGYITLEAESGAGAIKIAANFMPDLVILDLRLPDYNGIDVLSRLKKMNKDIQVVILTAFGSQDAARIAMEMGAFDFLTKPFGSDDVIHVVHKALEFGPPVSRQENHYA
jgi:DNA-binding NtrC family response regulator